MCADDPCAQPTPEEMAKPFNLKLPPRPWHLADLWWNFDKPIPHFDRLEMDVTIDHDVPSTYNLYISPCGLAQINGKDFYGGLQTNINGWASKDDHTRVHRGKGAIFSRWSSDKKAPLSLDHTRPVPGGLVESAGYEGEFCSVRCPLKWSAGTYTWQVVKAETEKINDQPHTWFKCQVRDPEGKTHDIGALRFDGDDFTYWARHSAFVEVYSTSQIPKSNIPKVTVTFGYPRINGAKPPLKKASVFHPEPGQQSGAPPCTTAKADGENIVVEVGPIFQREAGKNHYSIPIKPK